MFTKIRGFIRSEIVLCISAAAALCSMLLTKPSPAYFDYVDWDVLMLLFCLMTVVAGMRESGAFERMSQALLRRAGSVRRLSLLFIFLCFFSAMLVTNDVALIAFVPLAVAVTGAAVPGATIPVVVLMTVAANLGSMLTPVGNPQNLYLYSAYSLEIGEFLRAVLPCAAFSLVLLMLSALFFPRAPISLTLTADRPDAAQLNKRQLARCVLLFALCLLAVLKFLPVWVCFLIVLCVALLCERRALAKADYSLLLTFVCFFVLVGNLSGATAVRDFLSARLEGKELLLGAGLSQIISNVPAAVLLSSFTEAWRPLLLGVDIGGLGTPVASLASLIAYRIYARSDGAKPGRYMLVFLLWNVVFLLVLMIFALNMPQI